MSDEIIHLQLSQETMKWIWWGVEYAKNDLAEKIQNFDTPDDPHVEIEKKMYAGLKKVQKILQTHVGLARLEQLITD